jgi:ribosomal protein S18 acetylase RimI-like enzyme
VSAARILILNDLFVSPKARCLGIASKLLEAAASYGRAVGSVRLTLSTAVDNEAAQAVYVSKGWVRDRVFCTFNLAL